MSFLIGRLKRDKEKCEDKTLDNAYFREPKDKPEKEVRNAQSREDIWT